MFEHLDDPNPPEYNPDAVDRHIAGLIKHRHRVQAFTSVILAAALVAGGTAYSLDHHKRAINVFTGPTSLPACAAPAPGGTAIVVYNHPSIHVGWLPSGYSLPSGTAVPPNTQDPLTYQLVNTSPVTPTIEVIFDVGISSEQPIGAIPQVGIRTALEVSGYQASEYTVPTQPGLTYLEWSPQYETAVSVRGQFEDLATLRRVADSITTDLGPSTVITAASYLGPVVSLSRALAGLDHPPTTGPDPTPSGPVTAKLATYGELMATPGIPMSGGTDAADGTPVWVIYDRRAVEANPPDVNSSFAIVNATTGKPITSEQGPLKSFAWIAAVPDHQHIQPCTPTQPATPPATATTAPAGPLPVGSFPVPNVVGLSAADAGRVARQAGLPADIEAETITDGAPPGTVLAQQPPPGTIAGGVALTIAVPGAAPCTAAQLAITYLGGGASAGSDGATLDVRDTSPSWCDLTGPLTVVGVDSAGRPVTTTIDPIVNHPLVLTPNAPPPHGQPPPVGTIDAEIGLSAAYRDLPTGLCTSQQVIPAVWQMALPGGNSLTVTNNDPTAKPFPGLITCQGLLSPAAAVALASG